MNVILSLAGFIITALALSLGAPFWFDMLNKLVAIRGVGVKPEEKEAKKPIDNNNQNQVKDDSPRFITGST